MKKKNIGLVSFMQILFCVILIGCVGKKESTTDVNTSEICELPVNKIRSWIDIAEYYDQRFEHIQEDTIHMEFNAPWKFKVDDESIPYVFNMNIEVSCDIDFPTDNVRRKMMEGLDFYLSVGSEYYSVDEQLLTLKEKMFPPQYPDSVSSFLALWNEYLDRCTDCLSSCFPSSNFQQDYDTDGCVMCYKVYEDPMLVTYALVHNWRFNGSIVNPYHTDYCTMSKETGNIFVIDSVPEKLSVLINNSLKAALWSAKKENGYEDYWNPDEYTNLLELADGVAITNDGMLFYFGPYHVGCGVEGQYDLVIPVNTWKNILLFGLL